MRVLALVGLAACAGDDGGPGTTPEGQSWPSDDSLTGLEAFVAAESWRSAPWIGETATPRERNSNVSPHGRVRVWGNEVLVASQAAGNGEFEGTPHDLGSMAIKEMFDSADVRLGVAVMLNRNGDDWVYYCEGEAGPCGVTGTAPVWGVGIDTECGFCHGGLVFNDIGGL